MSKMKPQKGQTQEDHGAAFIGQQRGAIRTVDEIFRMKNNTMCIVYLIQLVGAGAKSPNHYASLPPLGRMAFEIFQLDLEFHNGGFEQFLVNTSGEFAEEIKEHLQTIGAFKALHILQNLSAFFPQGVIPKSGATRCEIITDLRLTNSDFRQYIASASRSYLKSKENLIALLREYLEGKRNELRKYEKKPRRKE